MSILRGSGIQSDPFVVFIPSDLPKQISLPLVVAAPGYSANIQNQVIDNALGHGSWTTLGRDYFESPIGVPGNGDLCRWTVKANNQSFLIWFDLSNVTLIANNPSLISKNPSIAHNQGACSQSSKKDGLLNKLGRWFT